MKPARRDVNLNSRVPGDLKDWFRREASKEDRSLSDIIVRAMERYYRAVRRIERMKK